MPDYGPILNIINQPLPSSPGSPAGGGTEPGSIIADFERAYNEALTVNQARYDQLLAAHIARAQALTAGLDVIGQNRLEETGQAYYQRAAAGEQNIISRGLYNTTVRDTTQQQIEDQKQTALRGIYNDTNQQKTDIYSSTTADILAFMERRQDPYPSYASLAELISGIGQADALKALYGGRGGAGGQPANIFPPSSGGRGGGGGGGGSDPFLSSDRERAIQAANDRAAAANETAANIAAMREQRADDRAAALLKARGGGAPGNIFNKTFPDTGIGTHPESGGQGGGGGGGGSGDLTIPSGYGGTSASPEPNIYPSTAGDIRPEGPLETGRPNLEGNLGPEGQGGTSAEPFGPMYPDSKKDITPGKAPEPVKLGLYEFIKNFNDYLKGAKPDIGKIPYIPA